MAIFKIVHPNGCPAHVSALHERMAIDMLVRTLNDYDWEFGQSTLIGEESGAAGILMVGNRLIPDKQETAHPPTTEIPVTGSRSQRST